MIQNNRYKTKDFNYIKMIPYLPTQKYFEEPGSPPRPCRLLSVNM